MENDKAFDFSLDLSNWVLQLKMSLWAFLPIFLMWVLFIVLRYFKKDGKTPIEPVETEITLNLGEQEIKYKLVRNYINLEIAHRIYIELITRKAAIPIDVEHDVLEEIYDSWYSLFQITREEIKKLSGNLLEKNEYSEELIKIATDVLNQGLRPHLTEHQARFRRWFARELDNEKNNLKSLQEIQKKYPDYENLIKSMKEVNLILINYASQLKKFIKGGQ
jgi:hypothetical protein